MKRYVHCFFREESNGAVVKVCHITNAFRIHTPRMMRLHFIWSLETGECLQRTSIKVCKPDWIDDPLIRQMKAKQRGKVVEEVCL